MIHFILYFYNSSEILNGYTADKCIKMLMMNLITYCFNLTSICFANNQNHYIMEKEIIEEEQEDTREPDSYYPLCFY